MNTLERDGKLYKRFYSWLPDNMVGSSEAIAYASQDGDILIGEYRSWNVRNQSTQTRKEKKLKKSIRGGYLRVSVNNKDYTCHRAVAIAWVDGFFDGAQVNHKNGEKTDNRKDNLEWVTASYNQIHISQTLKKRCGELHHNSKNSRETVGRIKEMLSRGVRGCDICKELNVSKYLVSDIKRGKAWKEF